MTTALPTNFKGDISHTLRYERLIGIENHHREAGQPFVIRPESGEIRSGVMLDVGVDLATWSYHEVEQIFGDFLDDRDMLALKTCIGMKGIQAMEYLRHDQVLLDIRIPTEAALRALKSQAGTYWDAILKRWPQVLHPSCPSSMHTALFDLVYCRGIMNRHLKPLDFPLRHNRWEDALVAMKDMQRRSADAAVKDRRAFFVDLVTEQIKPAQVEAESA